MSDASLFSRESEIFLFNDKPEASMAMGHTVACGSSLNELCQITFTPLLKSDSYYCADTKSGEFL